MIETGFKFSDGHTEHNSRGIRCWKSHRLLRGIRLTPDGRIGRYNLALSEGDHPKVLEYDSNARGT